MEQGTGNVKAKRVALLVFGAVLLVAMCVGVSYFVTGMMVTSESSWEHDKEHGHQWLHDELDLTPAEVAAVDAFEPEYRRARTELLADFGGRIAALRELLVVQNRFSPEVNEAIHGLHAVHGALQELSIRHYYDMMNVLPPEKQERLMQLAVEALSEPE